MLWTMHSPERGNKTSGEIRVMNLELKEIHENQKLRTKN